MSPGAPCPNPLVMAVDRTNTAVSNLAGRKVSTWIEEWRHECEVAAVLAMSPAQRISLSDASTDADRSCRSPLTLMHRHTRST